MALSFYIPVLPAQTPEPEQMLPLSPDDPLIVDETLLPITDDSPVPEGAESTSSVFVVLRMVLVLALAALAIYGVVFFIKRLASRPQEARDPYLKVLARVPLSSDTFAAVISLGAKAWLVAGASGGVNLISEITETESLETMLIEDAKRTAEAGQGRFLDFKALVRRFGASSPGGKGSGSGSSRAEKLREQRERLKGL